MKTLNIITSVEVTSFKIDTYIQSLDIPLISSHFNTYALTEAEQLIETMKAVRSMKTNNVYLSTVCILPILRINRLIEENPGSGLRANLVIHNLYYDDNGDVQVELMDMDNGGDFRRGWVKGFFDASHDELFPDEKLDMKGILYD